MATGEGRVFPSPDRGDGRIYVLTREIDEAVDVALATGRPLLLRGRPGSGKSSLAPFVAYQRGWRYYEYVVSHRTQPQDLLWHYDSVRRLADAQASVNGGERPDDATYVRPGILWWALAPGSAGSQGQRGNADPFAHINAERDQDRAVVLIDEIDKAEPDVPNSLLVPLGSYRFTVTQTGAEIRAEPPRGPADQKFTRHLVVITTNEERELPQAFLRRCVVLTLPDHDEAGLLRIAEEHMRDWHGTVSDPNRQLAGALAAELGTVRAQAAALGVRGPSTAEYLDALRACITLDIRLGTQRWERLRDCVLLKRQQMAEDDW